MINLLYVMSTGSSTGGIGQTVLTLLRNLDRNQFYPVIILPPKATLRPSLEELQVKVYTHPLNLFWPESKLNYYRFLRTLRSSIEDIVEIIDKEQIHLVHTQGDFCIHGGLAAKIAGVPNIWSLHGPCSRSLNPFFCKFSFDNAFWGGLINEFSNVIVAVSSAVRNSWNPYVSSEKIEVIYNGLELERFDNPVPSNGNSLKKDLKIPEENLLVCSVGRMSENRQKGFEFYVEAAHKILREMGNVNFLLVGPEVYKPYAALLKQRVSDLGLTPYFHFLGPRSDIPRILNEIDLFVSSSIVEGLATVCMETMASGKPVVATRCEGADDLIVDGETGFLVDIKDSDGLAAASLRLLKNEKLRTALGLKGKERVKELFDSTRYAKNFMSLYSRVHEQTPAASESKIYTEFLVNVLGEMGEIGVKIMEQEKQIKQFEDLMEKFKSSFLYRGVRKFYKWVQKGKKSPY